MNTTFCRQFFHLRVKRIHVLCVTEIELTPRYSLPQKLKREQPDIHIEYARPTVRCLGF